MGFVSHKRVVTYLLSSTDIYTHIWLYHKIMIYSVIDTTGIYLILGAQARVFIRYDCVGGGI